LTAAAACAESSPALMSGLAALLEQKLTGLNSYFGSPNCLSVPDPGRSTLASTALPSSPSSAASQNRGSLRDSSEAPEDGSMPWVPAPVRAERCLARSGTIDEGSLSAQPQNLGKLESLSTLKDEFKFNKSFGAKVDGLIREGYKGWRRVRGDGNCFYRAVGYSLIEQIILSEQRQTAAAALVRQLRELQLEEPAEQKAHERLVGHLERVAAGLHWQEHVLEAEQYQVYEAFNDAMDDSIDKACIRAMRRLTAKCILERADDFSLCGGISFRTLCEVQGLGTPEDFCEKVVLPMHVEAESVVMNAVVAALGVKLRLALLHRSEQAGLVFEDYMPPVDEGQQPVEQFVIHVQLRPGHYDLLYLQLDETPPTSTQRRATLACAGYGHEGLASATLSPAHTLEPERRGHFR